MTHLVEELLRRQKCDKVVVLGSASLLASCPELGESGAPLETTYDADFLIIPINREIAIQLGAELGKNTAFQATFGYHADILHPTIVESLPPGWEDRLVPMDGFDNVFALDPLDLAAVKVAIGREKDLALVKGLLELKKITEEKLRERLHTMPLGEREMCRAGRNFAEVIKP